MTDAEFLQTIRSFVARTSVGASTVRGAGNAGIVATARKSLRHLDLAPFGVSVASRYATTLNEATEVIRMSLPKEARHWGIARKVLNIYLRTALYTGYLRDAYRLDRAEHLMEVPLDSYTAAALLKLRPSRTLPRWTGVKRVTPGMNVAFQEVAIAEAERLGTARVHFDALWWSAARD